jgi:hypothetical protein
MSQGDGSISWGRAVRPKEAQEVEKMRQNGNKVEEAQMGNRSWIVRSIGMKKCEKLEGQEGWPLITGRDRTPDKPGVNKKLRVDPPFRLRLSPLLEKKALCHNERRFGPRSNQDGVEDVRGLEQAAADDGGGGKMGKGSEPGKGESA